MKKKVIVYLISLFVIAQLVLATYECSDGIDNDGDTLIDIYDPGCYTSGSYNATDNSEANGEIHAQCFNQIDDDNDGLIDAYDPGCYDTGSYNPLDDSEIDTLPICSNFFDDDNDGKIDAEDWGCYTPSGVYTPTDNNEANPPCSDGLDNDADTKIDEQDYGCYTESGVYKPYDNDETNPQCSDEKDNDVDCRIDYPADRGCVSVYDNSENTDAPYITLPDGGVAVYINVCSEDFLPLIWMCDNRIVNDDNVEQGRNGNSLAERINNYAFEGESISWDVLVCDKNGIEKIEDVYVTIGQQRGVGNDIEANCDLIEVAHEDDRVSESCNAVIDEEKIVFVPADNVCAYYRCTFTVETPDSMYGEYFVTAEVTDLDGFSNTFDETEYWYFNPGIALSIDGDLDFGTVRPGTTAYSSTLLVGNDADTGSGVLLDMFISGTDFYDSSSSGAKCPTTNQLSLEHLRYYATQGAYSTQNAVGHDAEGYVGINYGDHFDSTFYDKAEIIRTPAKLGPYYAGNILSPGSEIALTFKLSLPEPCNGDFDSGEIYFWGEAV